MKRLLPKYAILFALIMTFSSSALQAKEDTGINLRSSNMEMSVSQVQQLPHKTIRKVKKWGFYGHSTIGHVYEEKTINGDEVVVDKATGLTWHQSGSEKNMGWKSVQKWLKALNEKGYAGYSDWRLPTVEEAMSLLEPVKNDDGLYINAIFDKRQDWIWTGDNYNPGEEFEIGFRSGVWEVGFRKGSVGWMNTFLNYRYVRPLRSGTVQLPVKKDEDSVKIPPQTKPLHIIEDREEPPVRVRKEQKKVKSVQIRKELPAPVFKRDKIVEKPSATTTDIMLRSSYTELSVPQLRSLPHISLNSDEKWGFYGYSAINHLYEKKAINGDEVVVDITTGLTWHQSGSDRDMSWTEAMEWVGNLNQKGYAGYNDWRLPTVEEAASLLELSNSNNDLAINSLFNKQQDWIWTGDSYSSIGAWNVSYRSGRVGWHKFFLSTHYARPLRSGIIQVTQREKDEFPDEAALNEEGSMHDVAAGGTPSSDANEQKTPEEETSGEASRIQLRSYYLDLSVVQVQSMPYISKRSDEKWGFYGHSTIRHIYEKKSINGDTVILDNATGLMWHQSGSDGYMSRADADTWIRNLNEKAYAGYSDWRLPTLEEAASLLESSEKNYGLRIDVAFNKNQSWIWTGDSYGQDGAWDVEFGNGSVHWSQINGDINYYVVRPVRTLSP